ncbi:unnamed protein product, partial [Polarella glacialis]
SPIFCLLRKSITLELVVLDDAESMFYALKSLRSGRRAPSQEDRAVTLVEHVEETSHDFVESALLTARQWRTYWAFQAFRPISNLLLFLYMLIALLEEPKWCHAHGCGDPSLILRSPLNSQMSIRTLAGEAHALDAWKPWSRTSVAFCLAAFVDNFLSIFNWSINWGPLLRPFVFTCMSSFTQEFLRDALPAFFSRRVLELIFMQITFTLIWAWWGLLLFADEDPRFGSWEAAWLSVHTLFTTANHPDGEEIFGLLDKFAEDPYFGISQAAFQLIGFLLVNPEVQVQPKYHTISRLSLRGLIIMRRIVDVACLVSVAISIWQTFTLTGTVAVDRMDSGAERISERHLRWLTLIRAARIERVVYAIAPLRRAMKSIAALLTTFRKIASGLVLIFFFFSALGVQLFGGLIRTDSAALRASDFGQTTSVGYFANNFNDFSSGLVVLFELMVVNNWYVIAEGLAIVSPLASECFDRAVGGDTDEDEVWNLTLIFCRRGKPKDDSDEPTRLHSDRAPVRDEDGLLLGDVQTIDFAKRMSDIFLELEACHIELELGRGKTCDLCAAAK